MSCLREDLKNNLWINPTPESVLIPIEDILFAVATKIYDEIRNTA